jgi:ADP-ribose pyrophosphatase
MSNATLRHRRDVHRGHVIRVTVDTVTLPNGRTIELDRVHHPGAAAVVAVDADDHVLMVRQFRFATDGMILEVPAGKRDGEEDPERCARRELEEETGHLANTWAPLGFIWTTPGFCDERIWLYLATDLRPAAQALEDDEILTVERIPLADAVAQARSGAMTDGKSVCALLRAAALLEGRRRPSV